LNLTVTLDLPWLNMLSFLIPGILVAIGAGPLSLSGIAATVSIAALLISAFVVSFKRPWTRIMVLVAGSWVAAIGMLMFGWLFRVQG
jgi:hypothetical protein